MPAMSWAQFTSLHQPLLPEVSQSGLENGKFFFDSLGVKSLRNDLSQFSDQVIGEANSVMAGRYKLYSHHLVDAGLPPDWSRNQLTGEITPRYLHWSRIPDFKFGDIKNVWELNRFSFCFALVRAYARTADERFPELFWQLLEDWQKHNSPQQGANWKCGQEITFRLMAWIFAFYAFSHSPATTAARQKMLLEIIAASAHRIQGHIGYALSQRNNHGLSEATGLFTIGLLFPKLKMAQEWERLGRAYLEKLAAELIYDDGAFSQHSANYHRVMLHDLLWALRLGDLNHRPLSDSLKTKFSQATNFLYQIQDRISGKTPNYGQNDGALVLPLSSCDYTDFRPVLQAAYYYSNSRKLYPPGPWDEDLLWLFGPSALTAPQLATPRQELFNAPKGGCYVLRDKDMFAFVRCSKYTHRPAQADQLHVDVWMDGKEVVCDPGTFSYNAPKPLDKGFGGTEFHNTVTVDDLGQMDRIGKFMWLPWSEGLSKPGKKSSSGQLLSWQGEHHGYMRLRNPVRHVRSILLLQGRGLLVLDNLSSAKPHLYTLSWLCNTTTDAFNKRENGLLLNDRSIPVSITWGASADLKASFHSGNEDSALGWKSNYYSARSPALSVKLETMARSVQYWTFFGYASPTFDYHEQNLKIIASNFDLNLRLLANRGRPSSFTFKDSLINLVEEFSF